MKIGNKKPKNIPALDFDDAIIESFQITQIPHLDDSAEPKYRLRISYRGYAVTNGERFYDVTNGNIVINDDLIIKDADFRKLIDYLQRVADKAIDSN